MRLLLAIILIIIIASCANVVSPTGGPKDEEPPQLISTIPKQGQTNYHGKRIMLEFNELLKLKNPKDEIIITPDIKDVKYTVKKNIVNIDFDEVLKDSTTYSFSFREAIQDINEGNSAEDLILAFSTGDEIDSLEVSGNVNQLLKSAPAEKYTVAVYQEDTFNIFKHRPSYFTRTNKSGEFKLRNLKAGFYNIYAFEDKNKNLVLDSKSEKYGFLKDPIDISIDDVDSITIETIALDARPITITGIRNLGHFSKVRVNKNLISYKLKSLDSSNTFLDNSFSSSQSEIDIFPTKPATDSTLVNLIGTDSLYQNIDTTFYVKQTTAKSLKEKIKLSVSSSQFSNDAQKFTAEFKVTELIRTLNSDSIYILVDTVRRFAFNKSQFKYDTIFKKLTVEKIFERKDSVKWKSAKFVLAKGAFISIYGDSTSVSINPITFITSEETATIIIESETTSPNTLIEVLDERFTSLGIYPHSKSIVVKNLRPGSVYVRKIEDLNNNGRWDPGNPNLKIPPEGVEFYLNPEGKLLTPLRANWEVDIMWNF